MIQPTTSSTPERLSPLYEEVAGRVTRLVEEGTFRAGDRLPSVRALSREWSVSITTVMEAYRRLENRGVIEVRPQSGHFVRPWRSRLLAEPKITAPLSNPVPVTVGELTSRLLSDSSRQGMIQLGVGSPNPALMPVEKLNRTMASVARRLKAKSILYDFPPGSRDLRSEIARRLVSAGCALSPDDLVITNGCMEAVTLALRAICKPGDSVAIESPMFFGFLQALEGFGLHAVEIPTHPRTGMSIPALEYALNQHHCIKAVLVSPNFSNPSGALMPEENKQALVELTGRHGVALIEDDLYGDLSHADQRPIAAKVFDKDGHVLLCSSLSKTLAPGLRVGWVAPGRYRDAIINLKRLTNLGNATVPCMTAAEFLANGGYDHHLRGLRRVFVRQMAWLIDAIARHFPAGTRVSRPEGGFLLWAEMPDGVDAVKLYEDAIKHNILTSPGVLFSTKGQYRNCIRLNAAFATESVEGAVQMLGKLAGKQIKK